jgi:hypothetical protein
LAAVRREMGIVGYQSSLEMKVGEEEDEDEDESLLRR